MVLIDKIYRIKVIYLWIVHFCWEGCVICIYTVNCPSPVTGPVAGLSPTYDDHQNNKGVDHCWRWRGQGQGMKTRSPPGPHRAMTNSCAGWHPGELSRCSRLWTGTLPARLRRTCEPASLSYTVCKSHFCCWHLLLLISFLVNFLYVRLRCWDDLGWHRT